MGVSLYNCRRWLMLAALLPGLALAHGYRYGHRVEHLPPAHHSVFFGGSTYFYGSGVWFRAAPAVGYVVVRPPLGIVVPVLPLGFETHYRRGNIYYSYDDIYYVRDAGAYRVVEAPSGPDDGVGAVSLDVEIRPLHGQGETLKWADRFECHEWAAQRSAYDPTRPGGGADYSAQRRRDYLTAFSACLESHGYEVH